MTPRTNGLEVQSTPNLPWQQQNNHRAAVNVGGSVEGNPHQQAVKKAIESIGRYCKIMVTKPPCHPHYLFCPGCYPGLQHCASFFRPRIPHNKYVACRDCCSLAHKHTTFIVNFSFLTNDWYSVLSCSHP